MNTLAQNTLAVKTLLGKSLNEKSLNKLTNNNIILLPVNFIIGRSGDGHEGWEIPDRSRDPIAEMQTDIAAAYPDGITARFHVGDNFGDVVGNSTQATISRDAWEDAMGADIDKCFFIFGNHDYDRESGGLGYTIFKAAFSDQMDSNALIAGSTFERFGVWVGNTLHLMMSDANYLPTPAGGFNGPGTDIGYPTGAIKQEAWRWTVEQIYKYQDANICLYTHQAPKNTAMASGYFGYIDAGSDFVMHQSSYLGDYKGWAGSIGYLVPTSGYPRDSANYINNFIDNHPSVYDLHFSGHEHTRINHSALGVGKREVVNGITYWSISALTKHYVNTPCDPQSYTEEITANIGSNESLFKQWLHYATSEDTLFSRGEIVANRYTHSYRHNHLSEYNGNSPSIPSAVSNIQHTENGNDVEITWDGTAQFYMVLGKVGSAPSGGDLPVDDTGYILGDTIGSATVEYVGSVATANFKSIGDRYFLVIPFNSSGGEIKYNTTAASTNIDISSYDESLLSTSAAWWAARNITGLVGLDAVSLITDDSGNLNNMVQAVALNMPVYRTDVTDPAGHPVVRFSAGSSQFMTSPIVITGTGGFTMFFCCDINAIYSATNVDALIALNDNSGANFTNIRLSSQSEVNVKGLDIGTVAEVPTNTPVIFEITMPNGAGADDIIAWVNNFTQHTQTANTTAINIANAGGVNLGRLASVPRYASFDFYECVIYDGPLSTADRQSVREQLAFIHGIKL